MYLRNFIPRACCHFCKKKPVISSYNLLEKTNFTTKTLMFRSCDLNSSFHDEWLEKSDARADRSDPDFTPVVNSDNLKLTIPAPYLPTDDKVYLVYENHLEKLMKFCLKCGSPISTIDQKRCFGTQVTYGFTCLRGCDTK